MSKGRCGSRWGVWWSGFGSGAAPVLAVEGPVTHSLVRLLCRMAPCAPSIHSQVCWRPQEPARPPPALPPLAIHRPGPSAAPPSPAATPPAASPPPLAPQPAADHALLLGWDAIDPPETPIRPCLSSWCLVGADGGGGGGQAGPPTSPFEEVPPQPASPFAWDEAVVVARQLSGCSFGVPSESEGSGGGSGSSRRGRRAWESGEGAGAAGGGGGLLYAADRPEAQDTEAAASGQGSTQPAPASLARQPATTHRATPPMAAPGQPASKQPGGPAGPPASPASPLNEGWQSWPPPEAAWRATLRCARSTAPPAPALLSSLSLPRAQSGFPRPVVAPQQESCLREQHEELWGVLVGRYGYTAPPTSSAAQQAGDGGTSGGSGAPSPDVLLDEAWYGPLGGGGRLLNRGGAGGARAQAAGGPGPGGGRRAVSQRVRGWWRRVVDKVIDSLEADEEVSTACST